MFRQALFAVSLLAAASVASAQSEPADTELTQPITAIVDDPVPPNLDSPAAIEPLIPVSNEQPAAVIDQPVATTGIERPKIHSRVELPPPEHESFHEYLDDTLKSPFPYGYAFAAAVLDHWTGFPREWVGGSGFARQYAARVGQGIVADAFAHGVAAMLGQRIAYDPCRCSGVGPRTQHALVRAFVIKRNDGSKQPNYAAWISKYASSGIAKAWYPESYTRRDVIVQASSAVALSAGLNILREFAHFK